MSAHGPSWDQYQRLQALKAVSATDWRERCFRILEGVADQESVIYTEHWVMPEEEAEEIAREYHEWRKENNLTSQVL